MHDTTPRDTLFTRARVVLPDRVIENGFVELDAEGRIAAVGEGGAAGGVDCFGDLLIPGLVELHTDHIESHYLPRPKVRWEVLPAVLAYDAQIAASGITTVFDSLRIWRDPNAAEVDGDAAVLAPALAQAAAEGLLRADHFLHLRCEVPTPSCVADVQEVMRDHKVRLISLMDHTPGQRQFLTIEKFRSYYMKKSSIGAAEMDRIVTARLANHAQHAAANRAALVGIARANGIVLASHDDATLAHVAEAEAQGIAIAEFPTTLEAAEACRRAGIGILMGAPNLVRGGSHTGNASALDLAARGLLDILSSDYVPGSLMLSAFRLATAPGFDLPRAMACVAQNPAEAVGLADRGAIMVGRRGDLVRVGLAGGLPVTRAVWREGRRVS